MKGSRPHAQGEAASLVTRPWLGSASSKELVTSVTSSSGRFWRSRHAHASHAGLIAWTRGDSVKLTPERRTTDSQR